MAELPRDGYFSWSRDPAVGLFAVLPVWVAYEVLRLTLTPDERNGAEAILIGFLRVLGPTAFTLMRVLFGIAVLAAAVSILRRDLPWLKVTLVSALEGLVYALILGPLAGGIEASSARVLQIAGGDGGGVPVAAAAEMPGSAPLLVRDLVGSLGAGLFEELVFRLILLSLLALLWIRVAQAFGLPRAVGVVVAVVLSSLLFSLFHHIGPGAAPFERRVFVFRAVSGLILGVMFVLRGFGVCVYAHALYDLHYYLTE